MYVNHWNTRNFLINPTTNTVVFHLQNINNSTVPPMMYSGMYYLYVNTNGCISPVPIPGSCPPSPFSQSFGYVYKHYPSGTYQNGQK